MSMNKGQLIGLLRAAFAEAVDADEDIRGPVMAAFDRACVQVLVGAHRDATPAKNGLSPAALKARGRKAAATRAARKAEKLTGSGMPTAAVEGDA